MKCVRPRCTRRARKGKDRGLCHQHYHISHRGYVDAGPCKERIQQLRAAGFGIRELEALSGVSEVCRLGDRVQVRTHDRIMAIPVPELKVALGGRFSSLGSHRRIRGLMALGWTNRLLAQELGMTDRRLSQIMRQPLISAKNAKLISDVYDRLCMTLGPSNRARVIARNKGWVPPLAWNEGEIDDPEAVPNTGTATVIPFPERLAEVTEYLGITGEEQIAAALGITRDSLDRAMYRHGLKGAA